MNSQKLSSYAPLVLRFTLVAVYAWFGSSQLMNPEMWTRVVPDWAITTSGFDALMIIKMNGVFEVVASILLALGIAVRYVSVLLFLHLLVIGGNFGVTNPTGIRDLGLSFATLALALFGQDKWSLYPKATNDAVSQ